MDTHYPADNHHWNPGCDYACQRPGLIASILELAQAKRVVVIRATSQVGKSTLLRLLGLHILHEEKDLELAYFYWKTREERDGLSHRKYLDREEAEWQENECQISSTKSQSKNNLSD